MAAPVNTITYGLYTFPFAKLTTASGVLYAEDGFTRIGRRYQFTVTGVIGGLNQGGLSNAIIDMQTILKTPRLNLRIHWDGDGSTDLFFYVPTTTDTTTAGSDIDWGPKPGELNITNFAGGRSAFYTWTCSVNTMDTPLKSNVLAATWQWSHTVDPSGYTTRTVRGKILVDSGVVSGGQGADYYRNVVTQAVPVLTYFKRENQEYTQSEDGRVLSFSVTDIETYYTLPNPITAGHANWMVRLHGIGEADALMVDYVLSGWFESSANHSKADIIGAIMNLVSAKFGAVGNNTLIFGERVLREDVYGRNRIDFSISAVQAGGGVSTDGNINFNVGLQTFGIQPPDSNGISITINPYGETEGLTSGAFVPVPLLYDADPPTGVDQSGGYQFRDAGDPGIINAPSGNGKGGPPSDNATGPLVGDISTLQQRMPFVAFHEVISYEYNNHIIMLAPKLASADPIIQQTAVPTLKIIQAGYSRQIAKKASDIDLFGNERAFLQPDFWCTDAYISTPNCEPIAEGIFQVWQTEWRYVFVKAKQPTDEDNQLLPFDPRRPGSTNTIIQPAQLPTVTVDPNS